MGATSWMEQVGFPSQGKIRIFLQRAARVHFKILNLIFKVSVVHLLFLICPIAHNHCPQYAMIKVYDPYRFGGGAPGKFLKIT